MYCGHFVICDSKILTYVSNWLVLFRCGTVTRWRTSSWAKWCCPGRWRTPLTPRSFSWGSRDGRWLMRCPVASVWGSLLLLSWPPCDLVGDPKDGWTFFSVELCGEHLVKLDMSHQQSTKTSSGSTCLLPLDVHACLWLQRAEFYTINCTSVTYLQSWEASRALLDRPNVNSCYF